MSQFKSIPHIPTSDKLADIIFSKLKKIQLDPIKGNQKRRSDYSFYKTLYFRQFRYLFPEIENQLMTIVNNFPIIDALHPFHKELIDVLFGIEKLQTSLSRINNTRWALRSIEREVSKKLGNSSTADEAKKIRSETIGRVGSTLKKLSEPLDELIEAKIQLSKLPDFNLNEKTIAFAGPPNAGKSSFVKLVSTGTPEIASYPFTTKELICGHRKQQFTSYQLLDTPGLLDRPLNERNNIEMRSILALKYLADSIIFLYDPTEDAPLTLEHQQNLLQEIKEKFSEIPIYIFINKEDVLSKEQLAQVFRIIGKHPTITTLESNKLALEGIILDIFDKIPEKKLYTHQKKKIEPELEGKTKKENGVEWIFFD
ncbi:MAG: 50S ribosome-binding GTPase [Candidatus Heimdallarchaeota archaeon]|nr:50S ribosome-binding GTPase [Candidatus Heimdallarchaeota archaeon]